MLEMPKVQIDQVFDEVTLKDIKNMIAKAFNDLSANMRLCRLKGCIDEKSAHIARGKAKEMKREINEFIDFQMMILEKENQISKK